MKPPVRWLEAGSDAPHGAHDLLSSAAPVPGFSDALRYRLALGVAKTASLPAATLWSSLAVKGALVAGLAGASGLALHAAKPHQEQPVAQAPAPAIARAATVPGDPGVPEPVAVEALPQLQLPTAPPDRAPRLKLDPQLEEAELLEKARALVGSNPAASLKLTVEHSRNFPRGRLGAEAELIAAQSLLGMGNRAAAKARARASLTRYPHGLYVRQLREIVDN